MKKQTAEAFWVRLQVSKTGCWEWTGALNSTGYGNVRWHGKVFTTHRLAAWLVGLAASPSAPKSASAKTHVLHRCDNRKCCNPEHFFLGNYRENQLDAYAKGRKTQPRGSLHANAKLSVTQVERIREQYTKGKTQQWLADKNRVSQRCISLVVRGETYK